MLDLGKTDLDYVLRAIYDRRFQIIEIGNEEDELKQSNLALDTRILRLKKIRNQVQGFIDEMERIYDLYDPESNLPNLERDHLREVFAEYQDALDLHSHKLYPLLYIPSIAHAARLKIPAKFAIGYRLLKDRPVELDEEEIELFEKIGVRTHTTPSSYFSRAFIFTSFPNYDTLFKATFAYFKDEKVIALHRAKKRKLEEDK
jgi:hypothetical protein